MTTFLNVRKDNKILHAAASHMQSQIDLNRLKIPDYTNSQISALIDEHIHHARNRDILKDRLINGMTYDTLAFKYELSFQQIRTIVYKGQDRVFKYL